MKAADQRKLDNTTKQIDNILTSFAQATPGLKDADELITLCMATLILDGRDAAFETLRLNKHIAQALAPLVLKRLC